MQDSQFFQRADMSSCILLIWHILYNFSNFCIFIAFRTKIDHYGLYTTSLHSSDHGITPIPVLSQDLLLQPAFVYRYSGIGFS